MALEVWGPPCETAMLVDAALCDALGRGYSPPAAELDNWSWRAEARPFAECLADRKSHVY
jgi:hypothetical protein